MKLAIKLAQIACSALLCIALASFGRAAQHHGHHHLHHHGTLPAYDTTSEATLEGTVDELLQLERPGCPDCDGGTHVYLGGHDAEIHLCPSSFLKSQGCQIKEGDEIRVTGSKLTLRGSTVLLARELQCGSKTIALRDEDGRPLWRSQS